MTFIWGIYVTFIKFSVAFSPSKRKALLYLFVHFFIFFHQIQFWSFFFFCTTVSPFLSGHYYFQFIPEIYCCDGLTYLYLLSDNVKFFFLLVYFYLRTLGLLMIVGLFEMQLIIYFLILSKHKWVHQFVLFPQKSCD